MFEGKFIKSVSKILQTFAPSKSRENIEKDGRKNIEKN